MDSLRRKSIGSSFVVAGALLLACGAATAQQLSPEEVAQQAGSVKGTARACEIDTRTFDERVSALFKHMETSGASSSKLMDSYKEAALKSEHQQLTQPQVACNDFKELFGAFEINSPTWKPEQGWKGQGL